MNQIRAIQALNKKEIENGISPDASWHANYRDTAFVNFGGIPYEMSEGDIITIFSQFGEPVFLKLARDGETGKSKGFGWLKYEDQRSTDLAVDNIGGATIGGRLIRVDHARYKPRDDEDPDEGKIGWEDMFRKEGTEDRTTDQEDEEEEEREHLPEEMELAKLIHDHDDDDPMKIFLIEEKKKEVQEAKRRRDKAEDRVKRRHKERHARSHRSTRDEGRSDKRRMDHGSSRSPDLLRKSQQYGDQEKRRSRRDDSYTEDDRKRQRDKPRSHRRSLSPGDQARRSQVKELRTERELNESTQRVSSRADLASKRHETAYGHDSHERRRDGVRDLNVEEMDLDGKHRRRRKDHDSDHEADSRRRRRKSRS